ncbi:inosine-uridine preferring nucleoside hydrolase isoform X1 [Octopus sinensis]|uniref:Inosine-uridine preferring nucleoside hydrolase isoform X1 n=1 Tax=Octopus sinensis TaxID=2607531 RepID=A0A7E6FNQ0_9MOLL|nr:inosine-uridine preferring nucleoside hydrolase isoform X1 [Octopus sinensis]
MCDIWSCSLFFGVAEKGDREFVFPVSSKMSSKKIMINADPGIDDAQAIFMAVARPDIEIISLHIHHGNTTRPNAMKNALRILQACNSLKLPVFQGSDHALMTQLVKGDDYFGTDGFGNAPDPNVPSLELVQKEHSVWTMIENVKKYPGQITLVAMGPLTDLALAHRLYPLFSQQLKSCYIMGGNYQAKGNITRTAEFNAYLDPEASKIVLTEFQCEISLFPWELCVDSGMPWDFYDKLRNKSGKEAELMRVIEKNLTSKWKKKPSYVICDELAMAGAIEESTVKEFKHVSLDVELTGQFTRGQFVIDWDNRCKDAVKIRLVTKMNMDRVMEMLLDTYGN